MAHPILAVERSGDGALKRLLGTATGREMPPVQRESYLHIEIAEKLGTASARR